jgi:hypothetical protein
MTGILYFFSVSEFRLEGQSCFLFLSKVIDPLLDTIGFLDSKFLLFTFLLVFFLSSSL